MSILERKESWQDIGISSAWVFLAWLIWSITVLAFAFFIWNYTDLFANVYNPKVWTKVETLFSIILSIITLIWTSVALLLSYSILWATNPERYKKNNVIFTQIAFFQVLVYIMMTPVYLIYWWGSINNILMCYIFHVLIVIFWTHIILDILNNYRYVMIWIYWSFIWLFISSIIAIIFFNLFSDWIAKLLSLVFLLPIINFLIIFLKKLFDVVYYHFYRLTWSDPIWDIFYKIKKEDEENEKEEEQKNSI